MTSLTRIILLVALAALPLLAMSGPAHGAKKMEVAVQNEGVFLYNSYYDRNLALRQLRALGGTHIRMNVLWFEAVSGAQRNLRKVKPRNIRYDFSMWDTAVNVARAHGMKVQFALAGEPPVFACGSKEVPYECDGFKPNRKLYAHFVKATVKHFKGRVNRYSIWNEPNWYTWISPHKQAPLLYRKLVQVGYKAAKRADRKAEVVIGELAPHFQKNISNPPLKFIREMVCVNKKLKRIRGANRKCGRKPLKFDAFATHPYDFEHKPKKRRRNRDELTIANLGALPKLLNKLRKKGLIKPKKKKFPIYLTEHGYMVADNPRVRAERRIPEPRRAKWIVQSWNIAQKTPRIKQNLHFGFVSPAPTDPSGFFDMGLIEFDGTVRGSFTALQAWIRDAAADGRVARPGPCSVC